METQLIRSVSLFLTTPFLAATVATSAALAGQTEHRQHAAHEHGHGVLEVVAEGEELVIVLRVPAVNVIGFEHEPSTPEQRSTVKAAIDRFEKGARLFMPSTSAQCRLEHAEVELAGLHGEDEHGHDEKKGQHGHGSHDEKHDHAESEEETHSELHAEYHFECEQPDALSEVEVRVFEHLRDADKIDAKVVTSQHQGAARLTATATTLKLAQ